MKPGLPGQTLLPKGRAPPVDGVFEHRRHRSVVFRRDDQHAVGARQFVLEADDLGGQVAFVVLVVHRQIVDADELGVELVGAELDERLSVFAIDRVTAIAADDHGDLGQSGGGHG